MAKHFIEDIRDAQSDEEFHRAWRFNFRRNTPGRLAPSNLAHMGVFGTYEFALDRECFKEQLRVMGRSRKVSERLYALHMAKTWRENRAKSAGSSENA